MFQIMKLEELQCGTKHCFRNIGEIKNGLKSSIVSEIEYLGELLFWAQDMFQIMKLGELQFGLKHCFGNLGELQNGPKMYSIYQILESSKMGPGQVLFHRLNILVSSNETGATIDQGLERGWRYLFHLPNVLQTLT